MAGWDAVFVTPIRIGLVDFFSWAEESVADIRGTQITSTSDHDFLHMGNPSVAEDLTS